MSVSLGTIEPFPPINFDEVGNIELSHQFRKEGRINYPLMFDVVRPEFEELTSSGIGSLRSIHVGFLAFLQIIVGENIIPLRLVSVFIWCIIGALIFITLKLKVNTISAYGGTTLWISSLDGFIASHLVRPDIILGLIIVLIITLIYTAVHWGESRFYLVGFLAGISPGLHPHGLLIIIGIIFYLLFVRGGRIQLLLGILMGSLLWGWLCDFETYAISQHTYVAQLMKQKSIQYYDRLLPWVLIKGVIQSLLQPKSFYLPEQYQLARMISITGGMFFTAILFSIGIFYFQKKKNQLIHFCIFGLGIMVLGIGFGRMREEIIYNIPISVFSIFIVSWALTEPKLKWSRIRRFFLFVLILLMSTSSLMHAITISNKSDSIQSTWKQMDKIVGGRQLKILGPHILRLKYRNNFRDVNGLVLDYFYSYQKDPQSCIVRYQPDIIVIDNEIRRRFLVDLSDEAILPVPFINKWEIKGNHHHSNWTVFELDWN